MKYLTLIALIVSALLVPRTYAAVIPASSTGTMGSVPGNFNQFEGIGLLEMNVGETDGGRLWKGFLAFDVSTSKDQIGGASSIGLSFKLTSITGTPGNATLNYIGTFSSMNDPGFWTAPTAFSVAAMTSGQPLGAITLNVSALSSQELKNQYAVFRLVIDPQPSPSGHNNSYGLSVVPSDNTLTFTAVPEPSTYLAGLGALGILGLFSRRDRQ